MITTSYVDSVLWFTHHWAAIVGVAPMPRDDLINPVTLAGYLHEYAVSTEDQTKANHLEEAHNLILDNITAFDRMRAHETDLQADIQQLRRHVENLEATLRLVGK